MNNERSPMLPSWLLLILSWLVSFYFLVGVITTVGFPPKGLLGYTEALYLGLCILFLFLPFSTRVKVGFFELEREIERAKSEISRTRSDIQEFKSETRNALSVLSSSINAVSSSSNSVGNVAVFSSNPYDIINDLLTERQAPGDEINKIRRELLLDDGNAMKAVSRTQSRLEDLLRDILEKSGTSPREFRFRGLLTLFDLFLREYTRYEYLRNAVLYVHQVCDAAANGRLVTNEQARGALEIGARLIVILCDIQKELTMQSRAAGELHR
jgi:hypothetical protein